MTPQIVARQAPLSMGFSTQEHLSGLPCPPPEDFPNPEFEPASLMSPALAGGFFITGAMLEALDDMGCHLLFNEPKNYGYHLFQTV